MSTWTQEWPTTVGSGLRWFYGWPYGYHRSRKPDLYLVKMFKNSQGIMAVADDFISEDVAHGLWGPWVTKPKVPTKRQLCFSGLRLFQAELRSSWGSITPESPQEVFGLSEKDAKEAWSLRRGWWELTEIEGDGEEEDASYPDASYPDATLYILDPEFSAVEDVQARVVSVEDKGDLTEVRVRPVAWPLSGSYHSDRPYSLLRAQRNQEFRIESHEPLGDEVVLLVRFLREDSDPLNQ